jgi:hypothetical protein
MVPVEMSTLINIRPIAGRMDWKYPRPDSNISKRLNKHLCRKLTQLEASADVFGLAVGEEGPDVEGVRERGLHSDNDIQGLQ